MWIDEVELVQVDIPLLRVALPGNSDIKLAEWLEALQEERAFELLPTFNQVALFLAQTGHESFNYTRLEENLKYSQKALMQTWPSRFPTAKSTKGYVYNPRALANKVYGGRMGNVHPEDGWKYRGHGLIGLTGRNNYIACEQATGLPVVANPGLLTEKHPAIKSALWYWQTRVDDSTLVASTKSINGGLNGLRDRKARYRRIIEHGEKAYS